MTSNLESGCLANPTLTTGYEPNLKLKLNLKKKSVSEDSDATPIDDPNLNNFSEFSIVTRCADSSVSHVSCDGGVLRETNQLGSSNTLFSQVSCVGENVLGSRNLHLGNRCLWQRERGQRQNSVSVISVDVSISRKVDGIRMTQ